MRIIVSHFRFILFNLKIYGEIVTNLQQIACVKWFLYNVK